MVLGRLRHAALRLTADLRRAPRLLADARHTLRALRRRRNMEITAGNFAERLPAVERAIESALFVAIDGEFTGLCAFRGISPFDTPEDRYDKLQESAKQFLLVQFGLCTFHYDEERDRYTHQAFNFYVWPRPYSRSAPDTRFMCQTSSVDFLSSQNFDFNKLFREGISYLKPAEEQKLRDSIVEKQAGRKANLTPAGSKTPNGSDIVVPEEQKAFLQSVHEQIDRFLESDTESIELDRSNAFQRRLIYQTTKEKYKDVFLESVVKANRERVIKVSKVSGNDQQKKEEEKDQAEFDALDEAIGFSRIIRKLSNSGKLIVGHNMILDICHTINQFVAPLPQNYVDFKLLCTGTFPKILDTKLMANTYPFKEEISNSALEELKTTVSQAPYEMPAVEAAVPHCGYTLGAEKYHEAGYDAYITGLCFISMSNRMGLLSQDKSVKRLKTGQQARVLPDSHLIQPFVNKMYLMRISDIPYMNLSGDDLEPPRDHVFHVTFPSEWKTFDLVNLFSPFGNVYVSWLGDSSAFVSLNARENANMVMAALNSSTTYSIMPYKQYKSFLRIGGQTGITPVLENSNISFASYFTPPSNRFLSSQVGKISSLESKKRSASPESASFKRTKSVSEDVVAAEGSDKKEASRKTFEEPSWE